MAETNRYSICHDEELMNLICRGEVGAFDELYRRYSHSLMAYFTRMLNFNRSLAEDALQDLFLKIAEAPARFDRSRSFKTWIFCVASNSCKNYYRHRQVRLDKQDEIGYLLNTPCDLSASLVSRIDGAEFRKVLWEVLDELAPEKKEAFILRYQEEKTIAEIALIQDCPEGSVKSRLHYTLRLLENKLQMFNPVN